jgi:hypothetical protein
MGRVKASTLQQRFGFADPELTTPTHDALCSWVEENALEIARKFVPKYYGEDWSESEIRKAREGFLPLPASRQETILVKDVTWEPLLKNGRGYEVGFVDLRIRASIQDVQLVDYSVEEHGQMQGPPFVREEQLGVFLDYVARYGMDKRSFFRHDRFGFPEPPKQIAVLHRYGYTIWVECKSAIHSLGELFRQLALYRSCVSAPRPQDDDNLIVVVSPDDKQAERIRGQGYGFVVPTQSKDAG